MAAGTQLLFILFFWIAFTRAKKSEGKTSFTGLSVIVCAHDEERNLKELIPLLLSQDYPAFEIVIVDDRSNDGTYDFLLDETRKNSKLRMVRVQSTPEHINGKKYALTLGIKAAQNEWVVLTDADCRPTAQWLSAINKSVDEQVQFIIGASPYLKKHGLLNSFIRFESLITWIQFAGFALSRMPYMGLGRNLAYRKAMFLNNKGFNGFLKTTGGDDDLLVNKYGSAENVKVMLGVESLVYSIPKSTWKDFFNQKIRHLAVGKKYKGKHQLVLGLFMSSWIFTWFAGLFLLMSSMVWTALSALVLRTLLFTFALKTMVKRSGMSFEVWKTPFLDFIYTFYYLTTAPVALLKKRIRWKK